MTIHFLSNRRNRHPIRRYLQLHGRALAGRIVPMWYEYLLQARELPPGTYVFADVELLNDEQRQQAAEIWQRLAARGSLLVNHPERSMRRYELLRLLHAHGGNRFNVYRLAGGERSEQYPVFLRGENDHAGSRSPLLHSPEELAAAVRWRSAWWQRWLGTRLAEPLVTEFCDTADERGVYRKYSAFCLAGRIIPRHAFFSRDWQVKSWQLADERFRREEAEYVATNPHAEKLREMFAAARIDYGRIDYSLLQGDIQVWEINTNPMIVGTGRGGNGQRAAIHIEFARQLHAAWDELERNLPGSAGKLPLAA